MKSLNNKKKQARLKTRLRIRNYLRSNKYYYRMIEEKYKEKDKDNPTLFFKVGNYDVFIFTGKVARIPDNSNTFVYFIEDIIEG